MICSSQSAYNVTKVYKIYLTDTDIYIQCINFKVDLSNSINLNSSYYSTLIVNFPNIMLTVLLIIHSDVYPVYQFDNNFVHKKMHASPILHCSTIGGPR